MGSVESLGRVCQERENKAFVGVMGKVVTFTNAGIKLSRRM